MTGAASKGPQKAKALKKSYLGRVYIGRDENGKQVFQHIGRFAKKKDATGRLKKPRPPGATPLAARRFRCAMSM